MVTVDQLATELNEDARRLTIRDPRWATYAQEGVIVRLHISRWRGRALLDPSDLGLSNRYSDEREAFDKLVQLGNRRLLPKRVLDELMRLDTLARTTLKMRRYSLPTFWGQFVPRRAYATWASENARIQAEYFAYADQCVELWDSLLDEVRQNYIALGWQSYQRLRDAGAIDSLGNNDIQEWVKSFVSKAMRTIPSPQGFRESFTYEWEVEYIPFAAQQETTPAEMADAMEADLRRTAERKAREDLGRFVTDIQAGVRSWVYEATAQCLEAIKTSGTLPANSTKQLKNLVKSVDAVKFWPDEDLDKKLAELADLVEIRSDKRDMGSVESVLTELREESRLILLELKRPVNRGNEERPEVLDPELDLTPTGDRRGRDMDLDNLKGAPSLERFARTRQTRESVLL